jgi:hypothetical protein
MSYMVNDNEGSREADMTYGDIGELGLNDPLNQGIGFRINGRGGFIQNKDLASSSKRSHEGHCASAAITM